MRFTKKLDINLFDFFKDGTFDYIKLGQTKECILNNFPDPDDNRMDLLSKRNNIWQYGNIQFFFDDNILYSIFSDNFCNFNGGENLNIDKWILNENNLTLINILKILNDFNIDYEKETCDLNDIMLILKSGVALHFYNNKEIEDLNKNDYKMTSFHLTIKNIHDNKNIKNK